jgi:single-stranded-DNA-specific exonuclease
MLRHWIEPDEAAVPQIIMDAVKGHRLLAQTLYHRGLKDIQSVHQFLDSACYPATSPFELPNMDIAVSMLTNAIATGKRICVWGDFDVDGQTATTVLVTALRRLNGRVIHHIPVRARESHGVNLPVLKQYVTQGIDLLLTCDTGISSIQAVQHANQIGLPVIITDHHDLPPELPDAQAIINPKFLAPNHPLFTLPGVGVAYKLVEALFTHNELGNAANEFLDLVALGIVADLATIRQDTRYLLQLGLPVLRQMHRLGLRTLSELADLNPQNLTEEHISFVLAPRLNALGRLGDANDIVEFLSTSDPLRARILAYQLEGANANRKLLSEQVYRAALAQLESDPLHHQHEIIILEHPTWPAGVIGIAAARLVERFQKPVIIFSTPSGAPARGSARSIEGVNIIAAITTQSHLLVNFGGHPMAAGLSIEVGRIAEFRRSIARTFINQGSHSLPSPGLQIDGYVGLNELSPELVTDIERMAPFGIGNPPVVLASLNLSLSGYTAVGKHGEHLLMTLEDELGYTQQAIWWQGTDQTIPENKFDLSFTVRTSTYRGQKGIQLEWISWRHTISPKLTVINLPREIEVIDYRHETDPQKIIISLLSTPNIQIWCEEDACKDFPVQNRISLLPCSTLAIWSSPAGPVILRQVLYRAAPEIVYLFGNSTKMDQSNAFLTRLAGLCKYSLRHMDGLTSIVKLAAASNQRTETVVTGLRWLHAHGQLEIVELGADNAILTDGSGTIKDPDLSSDNMLHSLLNESAAYRKYFLREDKNRLINSVNIDPNLD